MSLAETHLGKKKRVLQNTVLHRRLGDVASNVERTGSVSLQLVALVLAVLNVSVMVYGGRPNHRHHYLERVFVATTLDITMTYFTK